MFDVDISKDHYLIRSNIFSEINNFASSSLDHAVVSLYSINKNWNSNKFQSQLLGNCECGLIIIPKDVNANR